MRSFSLHPDWFADVSVQTFVAFCAEHDLPIRFVGGCVRDTVMGYPLGDIDVATSALPDSVMEACSASPYKAIPTGLKHGTVTVIVRGRPFEMTTLRVDTACDGRHARVRFTDDWRQDALRRDFTFNALMLEPDGTLVDEVGGLEDAKEGRVRFIGNADARIREDYLRILRLFRFHATHGRLPLDAQALEAVRAAASCLVTLSVERIAQEMMKLLSCPSPVAALRSMEETGVLAVLFPCAKPDMAALERLVELKMKESVRSSPHAREPGKASPQDAVRLGGRVNKGVAPHQNTLCFDSPSRGECSPNPLLRLAVLYPEEAVRCAGHWKRSAREVRFLEALTSFPAMHTPHAVRHALYLHGRAVVQAALLRDAARDGSPLEQEWLHLARESGIPVFPVSGEDLKALGVPQGKALGALLRRLETEWIASDFTGSVEQLLSGIAERNG